MCSHRLCVSAVADLKVHTCKATTKVDKNTSLDFNPSPAIAYTFCWGIVLYSPYCHPPPKALYNCTLAWISLSFVSMSSIWASSTSSWVSNTST
jgi:hypothetical protein